ncbi:DNA-binding protein [Corynebacterium sp. CNJ-954]|nr:DNA-binding protein [Corynebacterium sp. CNJ-954]
MANTMGKRREALKAQVERRRYETMTQAAERTQLSVRSIRRYIAEGKLTGYRVGQRTIRLDPDEVDALFTPTTKWSGVA